MGSAASTSAAKSIRMFALIGVTTVAWLDHHAYSRPVSLGTGLDPEIFGWITDIALGPPCPYRLRSEHVERVGIPACPLSTKSSDFREMDSRDPICGDHATTKKI